MAISTFQTYLMHGTGSGTSLTYKKLIDINTFPDLGGAPETIDVTTLSDRMRVFILGIQNSEMMSFECNYDSAKYEEIKALRGNTDMPFAIWFGSEDADGVKPDGHNGKFEFKGALDIYVSGGGVNEPVKMTISIAPSTVITKVSASN